MTERWAVLDFETLSRADLKKVGTYRYCEDETTEALCLSWCVNDSAISRWMQGEPLPWELEEVLRDDGIMLVAHNAPFERMIFKHVMARLGWPVPPLERWACTLARCANLVLPLALENALKALGLAEEKDMEGNKMVVGWNREYAKTGVRPTITPEQLLRCGVYCDSDVENQRALQKRVGFLTPAEREVWLMNQRINDRGVCLDMPLVGKMQRIVEVASGPLAEEFAAITGGLKMTQIQKVLAWVRGQGVVIENMKKETLAELLGDDDDDAEPDYESLAEDPDFEEWERPPEMPPAVHRALTIRQLIGSSSIKKLNVMQRCVGHESRARGLLQYHGTGPGRETAKLIQPHNFPRGSIKEVRLNSKGQIEKASPDIGPLVDALMTGDAGYVEMLYGPPVEVVVSSLRHTIVAGQGRRLCAGDFAGIQARTVLGLAGQHDKTALMAAGADIYCDMATSIYRWPVTKLHVAERTIGKNSVLGLGFNMGAPTFQTKYAKEHPLSFCQSVVDTYRKEWAPEVPKVWYAFHEATLDVVRGRGKRWAYGCEIGLLDHWLYIELPSGRRMWYFEPRLVNRRMPWSTPEEPIIREAWVYKATKGGKWITVDAFGGKTTENVVMGIERDLMTVAMHKCEANGFPICLEVHDEIVTMPLIRDADETALQQIMEDVPPWCRDLQIPVSVEVWASDRYRK